MLLKIKHLKPFFSIVAALLLASLTATVSAQSDDEQYIKVTEKGTAYELVAMETNVVYNRRYVVPCHQGWKNSEDTTDRAGPV